MEENNWLSIALVALAVYFLVSFGVPTLYSLFKRFEKPLPTDVTGVAIGASLLYIGLAI